MTARLGGVKAWIQLVLACTALVGAGVCWMHARRIVSVAPIADGEPSTTSLVYSPQMLLLTTVLATTAGVLAVLGAARLVRGRRAGKG
ncbi:hypothetical protein BST11_01050 [Mycobacterium alsense]|uniref:Transmembrane protein n=1 Tax=Mycobacterium alsense TaxID=324058 RepID=A0AA41XM31_9MYCO|nr:hypothetical protein [Mycobacterium alsense]MCV7378631.1 hypothetical protein [Mycobacterium alsense]OQZ93919.1 hypothetical protein BST11_01050 [Mycobacterium alsense]